MFNAKTINDFLKKNEVDLILESIKNCNLWESVPGSSWDKRSIHIENTYNNLNKEVFYIIKNATFKIKEFIEKEYKLNSEIYPDIASINRWFPGMFQSPHADDMINAGVTGYEHRMFGSIIYLNNNYLGGRTYYPNHNFEIIPEIGKLAVHPGDVEHLHGVTTIEENIRYTISSFWTFEKERSVNWSLYK